MKVPYHVQDSVRQTSSSHQAGTVLTVPVMRIRHCMWLHDAGANILALAEQALDRQLSVLGASTSSSAAASLDSCLGEVEDLLTYCDDILATGVRLHCRPGN